MPQVSDHLKLRTLKVTQNFTNLTSITGRKMGTSRGGGGGVETNTNHFRLSFEIVFFFFFFGKSIEIRMTEMSIARI